MFKYFNYYLDFHFIQSFPPSCINRDDTGSPKTCIVGGFLRSRGSSQSLKYTTRDYFREYLNIKIGTRTRELKNLFRDEIMKQEPGIDEMLDGKYLDFIICTILFTLKLQDKILFLISDKQKEAIVEHTLSVIRDNQKTYSCKKYEEQVKKQREYIDKKTSKKKKTDEKQEEIQNDKLEKDSPLYKYRKKLVDDINANDTLINLCNANPSPDIALFGRMAAGNEKITIEAASQFSHMISTHPVNIEYDYFSAVDDYKDTQGAAHIDVNEFCSFTGYRYVSLNVKEFASLIGKEYFTEYILAFAEALIKAMPTGKMHAYSHNVLPSLIYVTIRHDAPYNLGMAFEKPVSPAVSGGYIEPSENRFLEYTKDFYDTYVDKPECSWLIGRKDLADIGAKRVNINGFLKELEDTLNSAIEEVYDNE